MSAPMLPLLCAAVIAWTGAALAEEGVVWAEVTTNLGNQDVILVTYPHPVGRREAIQDFQNLSRWGRWPLALPEEDGTFDIVRGCDTYRATIPAEGAIVGATSSLNWEVFAFTFRRFSAVNIVYDIGSPFFYKGPTGYLRNEFVRVSVQALPESRLYAFRCSTLSDAASQPSEMSAGLQPLETASEGGAGPGLLARIREAPPTMAALLLICGVLLGLSCYLLISALRERALRRVESWPSDGGLPRPD